jgi:hypothetical protein
MTDETRIDPRIVEAFDAAHDFGLADSLVMLCYVGSTSHNTYVPKDDPDSIDDVDIMGVAIPPLDYTLGLKTWEHWNFQRDELDVVIYSLDKFLRLLVKSNPNVLGTLWLRDEHYLLRRGAWASLVAGRYLFATRAAHGAFAGYANGQFKKMTAFDLQAQTDWERVNNILDRAGWTVEQIVTDSPTGMPSDPTLTKEELEWARVIGRKIHARHFQGYMGEKRKNLVKRYGYDCKNAAHLIRLLRMCVEFLGDGEMRVWRTTDAADIRAIKSGEWPLERVQEEAEQLFQRATLARDASPLPYEPDRNAVSALAVSLHAEFYDFARPAHV